MIMIVGHRHLRFDRITVILVTEPNYLYWLTMSLLNPIAQASSRAVNRCGRIAYWLTCGQAADIHAWVEGFAGHGDLRPSSTHTTRERLTM
jgi:hypothetical protein